MQNTNWSYHLIFFRRDVSALKSLNDCYDEYDEYDEYNEILCNIGFINALKDITCSPVINNNNNNNNRWSTSRAWHMFWWLWLLVLSVKIEKRAQLSLGKTVTLLTRLTSHTPHTHTSADEKVQASIECRQFCGSSIRRRRQLFIYIYGYIWIYPRTPSPIPNESQSFYT